MKVVDSSSLLNQRGLLGKRARDIMTPMPLKVGPEDDVLDVVATMVREGVRHLPVVDADRRVIGIVSDRDLRTAIGDPIEALEHDDEEPQERWPIEAVMSRNPINAHVDASLAELAKCLVDERRLPRQVRLHEEIPCLAVQEQELEPTSREREWVSELPAVELCDSLEA